MKKILIFIILSFIISSPALAINPDRWHEVWAGYGYTNIKSDSITLKPKSGGGHSALVVGPKKTLPLYYKISLKTTKQLRPEDEQNPWEVGWVIWNYADKDHFYYFILKPNGWELGKRDPAYEGGQRFLATGPKKFPINQTYRLRIKQSTNNTIRVYYGQKLLTKYQDLENPYQSGKVGVYSEDAKVRFSKIKFK